MKPETNEQLDELLALYDKRDDFETAMSVLDGIIGGGSPTEFGTRRWYTEYYLDLIAEIEGLEQNTNE